MHLAVDALGIKHSGGATVLLDFLHAALDDDRVTRVTIFCSPRAARKFDLPLSPKLHSKEMPLAEMSYPVRLWWFQVALARECRRIGADVLVCMVGSGRTRSTPPHVTFIQQSLPFSREALRCYGLRTRTLLQVLKYLMRSSCHSAQRVVVQTPTMKRWVSEQLKIPATRIDIVLPSVHIDGLSSAMKVEYCADLVATPIILYVGSDAPYKNVKTVVEGMKLLRGTVPGAILHVTWPLDHPISQQLEVNCVGFLSSDHLAQEYQQSAIVVMPSLVETVGLPMLEAMSLGVPVLAADRLYAHDICGDAAWYFDPLSSSDFAQKAKQLLIDSGLRSSLIAKGHALSGHRLRSEPYAKMVDLVLSAVAAR